MTVRGCPPSGVLPRVSAITGVDCIMRIARLWTDPFSLLYHSTFLGMTSLYLSLGFFWSQSLSNSLKETPLVSMHQRPLIVPATLHFSGLRERSEASRTQETTRGKGITRANWCGSNHLVTKSAHFCRVRMLKWCSFDDCRSICI